MDKILDILQDNARTPIAQIAKRLDRDEKTIQTQIQKLEDDGVILGYKAILDPKKAQEETVTGIIEVKLTPQRGSGFDKIAERIYRFPEVKTCYLISGGYDLQVIVEGQSLQQVATFVSERLSTVEHVAGTATHFILKKYKDVGVILTNGEHNERLAVSP